MEIPRLYKVFALTILAVAIAAAGVLAVTRLTQHHYAPGYYRADELKKVVGFSFPEPAYVPDGLKRFPTASVMPDDKEVSFSYQTKPSPGAFPEKWIIVTVSRNGKPFSWDPDPQSSKDITVHGRPALLYTFMESPAVRWRERGYWIMVQSLSVSTEEVVRVAESIRL